MSQHRTITTTEELWTLPHGAIVMSTGRYPQYADALWRVTGNMIVRVGKERDGVIPFGYFVDPLPVEVLHEPGQS